MAEWLILVYRQREGDKSGFWVAGGWGIFLEELHFSCNLRVQQSDGWMLEWSVTLPHPGWVIWGGWTTSEIKLFMGLLLSHFYGSKKNVEISCTPPHKCETEAIFKYQVSSEGRNRRRAATEKRQTFNVMFLYLMCIFQHFNNCLKEHIMVNFLLCEINLKNKRFYFTLTGVIWKAKILFLKYFNCFL